MYLDGLIGEIRAGGVSQASHLLHAGALQDRGEIAGITLSGGVSEFIYERTGATFGDLGPLIAGELRRRVADLGAPVLETSGGIRATVIGASQYTIQVSGSTIFVSRSSFHRPSTRPAPGVGGRYVCGDDFKGGRIPFGSLRRRNGRLPSRMHYAPPHGAN